MNTGSALARFTITLSQAVTEPVQVEWFTSDGTAKAGVDYAANKGTVVFAPGETAKTVDILVYGRAVGSEDRSFFVEMLPPTNAILGTSIGECIITVDTSGSTPVTAIIVPTGPKGDKGEPGKDAVSPDPAEIAIEVAPLIDVGSTVLTAEGTESQDHPDQTTVKAVARRVAYAAPAKIATVVLADGDNTIPASTLSGVNFSASGFYPRVWRAGSFITLNWSVTSIGQLVIKSAVAGDVLYAVEYMTASVLNSISEIERQFEKAAYNKLRSFQKGNTVNAGDALFNEADLTYYEWKGPYPKVVPASSTPASAGGIGPTAWVSVGDASYRTFLKTTAGAGGVGYDKTLTYVNNTVGKELQNQGSDIDALESKLPYAVRSLPTVLKKANDGETITIACYGDSLTYGQDTSATGGQPPINGATQGRSPKPYPEMLGTSLSTIGITATIRNRGYPGDTSADGLTRWATDIASDVAIIMYGTNDAINAGGTGLVSVDDFRKNIVTMIEREAAKGAAVILMSPPNVAERIKNAQIAPYRAQVRLLAEAYGLPFIDAAEQLETITNLWTDNLHLTTFGYTELGWHIASLFANREGSILTVGAGQLFHPTDHIGYGGSTSFKVVSGSKGANYLIELAAGQVYAIGVYCDEDVIPVIHSVNSQVDNSAISAYYAGAPSATSGVKTAGLAHASSLGYRQKLTAQKLSKGYRTLYLLNNGTAFAYIEAVEFQSISQPAMTLGFFAKSDALSGIHQPARISNATNGWVAADVSRMLTADCQFCARLTLGTEAIGGIALMNGFQVVPNTFSDNVIMAIRSGAILGIREIINGVVGADTPASGVFPATGTWTGEIEMEIVGTTCNVYVDGVLKVTKTGITVNRGYPALYGQSAQRITCHSALIKGYTKAIYE